MIEIVEEEEEEWPEAGAQNVAEAEQYQDKINNIFDTLSILIHQDTKTALSDTIQILKRLSQSNGQYGGSRHRRGIEDYQGSDGALFTTTLNGLGASRWWTPLKIYHLVRNS